MGSQRRWKYCSGANTATPTVNAAGTYTLTVTNPDGGCTATDFAVVTLNVTPPNVNAGADKILTCTTTSIAWKEPPLHQE